MRYYSKFLSILHLLIFEITTGTVNVFHFTVKKIEAWEKKGKLIHIVNMGKMSIGGH